MVQKKETESEVKKTSSTKKAATKAPGKAKAKKAAAAQGPKEGQAAQTASKQKKARGKKGAAGKANAAAKTDAKTLNEKKEAQPAEKQETLSLLGQPSTLQNQPAAPAAEVSKEAPAPAAEVSKEASAPAAEVSKEAPAPVVEVSKEASVPAAEPEAPALPKEQPAPAKAQEAEAPAQAESKAPAQSAGPADPAAVKHEQTEDVPAGGKPNAGPKPEPSPAPADAPLGKNKAEHKVTIQLKPNPDGSKLTSVTPRPMIQGNPYKPMAATVAEVIRETHNIVTIRAVLDDPEQMKNFVYEPGQVGQLSVFGVGESTFVINTPPSQKDYIQFSVMRAGEVTTAIHGLSKGDKVGVRAPLGRPFPYELWKGKDVFFIGGGIGMAPIRTIMLHLLENKQDYGKISLLYGGRSPQDLAFSYELDNWMERPDLDCTLTIDREAPNWPHRVGLIPNVLRELKPSPNNCIAVLCGPPIMIKFTLQALDELGFDHENVYTTLEKRMKCGIGICGRCGIGGKYVCLDGPVFSQKELDNLPPEL